MNHSRPIVPLKPSPDALREVALASIARAGIHLALHASDRNRPPLDDRLGDLVALRSPTAPMKTTDATALTQIALSFAESLQPTSAAAEVFARGLQVSLDGLGQVSVPGITLPLSAWLSEAGPISVNQGATSVGAVLTPFTLGMILTLTAELYRSSNAEQIFRQTLTESAGAVLDSVFFSSNAGVANQQPSGILNGITALTAGSSMSADMGQLVASLAPVLGASAPIIVASPAEAMVLNITAINPPGLVLAANALPPKTIVGLAPQGIAVSLSAPRIELASSGSLVMAAPASDIVTSPSTVGTPQKSLFQTDTIALRFILPVSWARRSNSAVAWVTGVNW